MTDTPHSHPPRINLNPIIAQLGLFLLVLLVYSPSLTHDFVYDDFTFIVDNRAIQDWSNIPSYFTDPGTFQNNPDNTSISAWRPLRNISYLLDYKLFGLNPSGWHLHNIILHSLTALLVFHLLVKAAKSALPATCPINIYIYSWILSAAWALHPVNLEIAAWVKSRDDLLATLFALASLIQFLNIGNKKNLLYISSSTGFLILALLSKESIVLFPLMSAVLLVLLSRQPWAHHIKNRALIWGLTTQCVCSLTYLLIRHLLLGKTSQSEYLAGNFSHTMATMTFAGVRYMQLTIWPFWPTSQTTDYKSFPLATTWLSLRVILSTLLLMLSTGLTICLGYKNRLALAGGTFIILAFIPVLNIVPMMQIMAERFLYLPLIGLTMLLLAGILNISTRLSQKQTQLVFATSLVLTFLIITTLLRLPTWKNNYELYVNARNHQPESPHATNNLAYFLWRAGRANEALAEVDKYLARHPKEHKLEIMRASILMAENNTTAAKQALDNYESRYPANAEILSMRSDLAIQQGRYADATNHLQLILQHNPKDSNAWYNLAVIQVATGQTTAAQKSAQSALAAFPNHTQAKLLIQQIDNHLKLQ